MLVRYSQVSSDCEPPSGEELRNWQVDVNFSKDPFQNPQCHVINEAFPQAELIASSTAHYLHFYLTCLSFFLVLHLAIYKCVFTCLPSLLDFKFLESRNYVLLISVSPEPNTVPSVYVNNINLNKTNIFLHISLLISIIFHGQDNI